MDPTIIPAMTGHLVHECQSLAKALKFVHGKYALAISLGHTIIPTGKRRLHRASFVGNASL